MQSSDSMDKKLRQTHPWDLLAEYKLDESITSDDQALDIASGLLIESVGDLELGSAQLSRIKESLVNATRNAIKHTHLKESKLPVSVRLYYQKKKPIEPRMRETFEKDLATRSPGGSRAETTDFVQKSFEPDTSAETGWGYFLTERKVEQPGSSPGEPTYLIELFLYTEEK
jgi:hypothetical protein